MELHLLYILGITSLILPSHAELPYVVNIDRIKLKPESNKEWFIGGTLRSTKMGRNTFSISGDFELKENYGNDEIVSLIIYAKNLLTDQYIPAPILKSSGGFCSQYKRVDVFDDLVATSNAPPRGTCPIPKNKYTVKNFVISPEHLPKEVPVGEYKIDLNVEKDNKLLFGYELYITVTRK